MHKTPSDRAKGFTLVETLVAISILVVAVTGAFAAAQNGISSAIFSKDQIVAFYLAQEGVEYVRNIRDQNGLADDYWLEGIPLEETFMVDAVNGTLDSCFSPCPNIRLNDSGFYAYDSGTTTPFRREIILESVDTDEVAITVTVYWSKGTVQRTFRARENIFNWQ